MTEERREVMEISYRRSLELLEAGDVDGARFHKSYLDDVLTRVPATDPLHAVAADYVAALDEKIEQLTSRPTPAEQEAERVTEMPGDRNGQQGRDFHSDIQEWLVESPLPLEL